MDAIFSCLCYERCVPAAERFELRSKRICSPPENLDVCFYCVYIVLKLSFACFESEIRLL
jgi:hypothetical protein